MKIRLLIAIVILLSTSSCSFFKGMQWAQAEEFAYQIEADLNNQQVNELVDKFSAPLFARRLGKEFTRLSVPERSYSFGIFKQVFRTAIEEFTTTYNDKNLQIVLTGMTEKDEVYRAIFTIVDEDDNIRNFLVFYLSDAENDRFQIANYYSVYTGFSFGQSMKEFVKMINDSSNFENEIADLNYAVTRASNLYKQKRFEQAYEILNQLPEKDKKLSYVASLKLLIADEIGGTIAKNEFKYMQSIVPNEQSKLLYDCILKNMNHHSIEDIQECSLDLQMLLLES